MIESRSPQTNLSTWSAPPQRSISDSADFIHALFANPGAYRRTSPFSRSSDYHNHLDSTDPRDVLAIMDQVAAWNVS